MAKNELMMKMIIELQDSIKKIEKLVKATKKSTKATEEDKKAKQKAKEEAKKLAEQKRKLAAAARAAAKAQRELQRRNRRIARGFVKATVAVRSFIAALTGIGALAGLVFILGKATRAIVEATAQSIKANAKLEAVLRATGHAAGFTKMQMDEMSFAMSRSTTFAQTSITEAQGIMATFTKLGHDVFPQAISAAADMSTMFGQTLPQSAIQLGTALNDPINGIGRLMRIGVSFSEQQKNQIQAFMAIGDVASAQGVILAELEQEFGGAAEAVGDTLVGAIEQFRNEASLAGEQMGILVTMFSPFKTMVQKAVKWITKFTETPIEKKIASMISFLKKAAEVWFNITGVFQTIWNVIMTVLAAVMTTISFAAQVLGAVLEKASLHAQIFWEKIKTVWNGIPEAFKIVLKNLQVFKDNWINLIGLAFNGMRIKALKGMKALVKGVENMVNAILDIVGIPAIAKVLGIDSMEAGIKISTPGLDAALAGAEAIQAELAKPFEAVFSEIKEVFTPSEKQLELERQLAGVSVDGGQFLEEFKRLQAELGVKDPTEALTKALEKIGNIETDMMDQIIEQFKQDQKAQKEIEENNKNLETLNNSWLAGAASITRAMEAAGIKMDQLGNSLGKAFAEGGSVREIIGNAIAQTMGNIAAKSTKKSVGDAITAQFGADKAAGEMAQGLVGLMGGIAGGLVGGLVGKLFSKKPKPVKKPIPVKVVNWGDMTQQLLKVSARRAVSPMITTGSNSMMSSNFGREARI